MVDDDFRVLESLAELLEASGYTVHAYLSAQSLLDSGMLETLDCLITDVGMPGMDGFELCRRTRAERPGLPVVFLTARHNPSDQRRAEAQGDCELFRKPFQAAILLAAVDRMLQGRQHRRN